MAKKVTSIDRTFLRTIRDEAEAALQALAEKYGVTFSLGSASFTPSNATFKLQVATTGSDGEARTKEAEDFKRYATSYGLKADDLNREFTDRGRTYKIIGCKPRSTAYPLLCERDDGKVFKYPVTTVVALLKLPSKPMLKVS